MEIYYKSEQTTDDNMTHAHCTLVTTGYKHTLIICNTYCFPLQQWLHNSATFYVIRTLPVLLDSPEYRRDGALKHNSFSLLFGLCVSSLIVTLYFDITQRVRIKQRREIPLKSISLRHVRTRIFPL